MKHDRTQFTPPKITDANYGIGYAKLSSNVKTYKHGG